MTYEFNGAGSQYLSAGVTADGSTYPVTLAAWCHQSSLSTGIICSVTSASGNYFGIASLNTGPIRAVHVGSGQADTTTTAIAGTWNHACGVFTTASSRTAYLNAGGNATNSSVSATFTANQTLIGARRLSGVVGTYYTGLISEVGVWTAELTPEEIASLADGMTCDKVRPQSLVFYAPLVRDLIDYKGGLTITNNNTATVANHTRVYL
jgi:hypothetical protein